MKCTRSNLATNKKKHTPDMFMVLGFPFGRPVKLKLLISSTNVSQNSSVKTLKRNIVESVIQQKEYCRVYNTAKRVFQTYLKKYC